MYPTTALQPGSTDTAAVKKLQDYLVSRGLMSQADLSGGYGTYGPKTTAAVQSLQSSLGIDYSSGPGYFGPKTIDALKTQAPSGTFATTPGGAGISTASPTSTFGDKLIGTYNGTPIYQMANGNQTNATRSSFYSIDPATAAGFVAATADSAAGGVDTSKLTTDQKSIISDIVNTTDPEKLKAAISAASQYSDPYFKAQAHMAIDALDRATNSKEGDLHYQESSLRNSLAKLQADTAASKDHLSFQHAQELKQLETKYQQDLSTTQDNLAASGFTSSSKRARAEDILAQNNQGLVESSNKTFGYQTGVQDRNLGASEAATQAQIENLQRLASEGKLDLLRQTEGKVGSDALSGYAGLLGGQPGSLVSEKNTQDIAAGIDIFKSGASNFVF